MHRGVVLVVGDGDELLDGSALDVETVSGSVDDPDLAGVDCLVVSRSVDTGSVLSLVSAAREREVPVLVASTDRCLAVLDDLPGVTVVDVESGSGAQSISAGVERLLAEGDVGRRTVPESEPTLDRITDAFLALDRDWTITYINDRGADIMNVDRESLVGRNLWEEFTQGTDGPFHEAYREAFDTQEPRTVTARSRIDSDVWVEARAFPSEDGLSIYFRDVTEQKTMERRLRERNRKIEALHRFATDLARSDDEAAVFDRTVAAAESILEFDICWVGVVRDGDFYPMAANDETLLRNPVIMSTDDGVAGRAVRTGRTQLVDEADDDPDAKPVDEDYVSALTMPLGKFGVFQALSTESDAFSGIDRELGELLAAHVTAAVERIRQANRVRENRDRLAALFDNVPDPAVQVRMNDGDPIVEAANGAFERVFGINSAAGGGENLDRIVVPPDAEDDARRVNEALASGEPLTTESRRATAAGMGDFLVTVVPVSPGEGYIIYTDITEQKERERTLERQNDRLDRFASIVSHDLRNPISVIDGYAELLAEERDSEHLERIADANDRMGRIVDDVLELARRGVVVDDPEPCSLPDAVRSAWATVETGTARLEDRSTGYVMADRGRLGALLENLFRNAVDHGGPAVTVTVESLPDGFAVVDDGPGFDTDEDVFEWGYTSTDDGTGFGLAIVREIVEAHRWSVDAVAGADGGVRFVFSGIRVVDGPDDPDGDGAAADG